MLIEHKKPSSCCKNVCMFAIIVLFVMIFHAFLYCFISSASEKKSAQLLMTKNEQVKNLISNVFIIDLIHNGNPYSAWKDYCEKDSIKNVLPHNNLKPTELPVLCAPSIMKQHDFILVHRQMSNHFDNKPKINVFDIDDIQKDEQFFKKIIDLNGNENRFDFIKITNEHKELHKEYKRQ